MNELLEQHFDTAFAAPDGIAKLRELILTLAMQGKLVEQDPNDPPASELLKEIETEKQRISDSSSPRRRGSSKSKPLPPIKPEEMPYELPQGWEWVRLGDIVLSITGGGTPSKNNPTFWGGDIPWASVKDLNVETYLDSTIDSITEKAIGSSSTNLIPKGSIIVCTRMGLGKIAINRVAVAINQDLKALTISSHVDQMFFFKKYKNYKIIGSGMTVHGIRQDELLNFLFPLPPFPEQHRIVARIDQLMARCDAREKLRKEREEKRLTVHTAAVRQLLDASSSSSHACPREDGERESSHSDSLDSRLGGNDGFDFIQQHFGELYTIKQNVAELRNAILQLAVMGRLVPQDPNDPPASELLKEIEKEKASREGAKTRRGKEKKLPPIKPEEVHYELPQGWEWVRVWDIAQLITSGSRDWAQYYSDSGAIFVTMGNLSRGNYQLRMDTIRYVSPPTDGEGSRTKLEENDLLISITGDVGNLGLIPSNFGEAYINQHTCLLRFMPNCRNRYFPELMRAPLAKEQFDAPQRGIKNSFRLGDVGEMIIPLPPLPEQHRIVARIDQLMALCDALDQQIDATSAKQAELLNAVMAQV